jgi:hypothetical protein
MTRPNPSHARAAVFTAAALILCTFCTAAAAQSGRKAQKPLGLPAEKAKPADPADKPAEAKKVEPLVTFVVFKDDSLSLGYDTLARDGDPLDALVLLTDPTFPGCRVRVKVLGVIDMSDEKGEDAKVLCAAAEDPTYGHLSSYEELEPAYRAEIEHFFAVYKDLQPGAHSTVGEWSGPDKALAVLDDARRRADSGA